MILLGLLIISCATNKSVKPWKSRSKPKFIKRDLKTFNYYYKEFSKNLNSIKITKENKRDETKTKYKNFKREDSSWEIIDTKNEQNEAISGAISPCISPDGKFLIVWQRRVEKIKGKETIYYRIIAQHCHSRAIQQIFETNSEQFMNETSYYFPAIAWCPFGNIFAFSAKYNDFNNIFICLLKYDKTDLEIKYYIFQLTNNKEENVFYYDINWAPKGDKVAFTKKSLNETSYIQIYDFKNNKLENFGEGLNSSCFRFAKKDESAAFFVIEESEKFYPYFIKDIRNPNKKYRITTIGESEPLFLGNFADFSKKLAILSIDNSEQFYLSMYNYKNDRYYRTSESIKYGDVIEYWPNMNPIWLYNDNFVMCSLGEKICYSFLEDNFLNRNNQITMVNLKRGQFINSLTTNIYNKFYYSNFGKDNFIINSFSIKNLKENIREIALEVYLYEVTIKEYYNDTIYTSTPDTIKWIVSKKAVVKRKTKPINPLFVIDEDGVGYIQKQENGDLILYIDSDKIDDIYTGQTLQIVWPENIKSKKINVKVIFSEISQQKEIRKD